jgi:exopolysaccharide production protein ExoQ
MRIPSFSANKHSQPKNNSGWKIDSSQSVLVAALLWILLVFMSVPGDVFETKNMNLDAATAAAGMAAPNPLLRTLKLSLLSMGLIVILWRQTLARLALRELNVFFIIFVALVPLSALWSIEQGATIARFVTMLSILSVSFAFTLTGWHGRRFQNVVRPLVTVLLAGSLVFGILRPDLAIMTGEGVAGAWAGLFGQKNLLGQYASFGVIFWVHAWVARETKGWKALLGVALAATCLLLSRSSTSLLATIFVLMFIWLLLGTPANLRRYMPYLVAIFATLILTYALAVLRIIPGLEVLLEPIAMITGKDTTFSARSQIWAILKEHIQLSPMLGSGYGAYWIGPVPQSPSFVFIYRMYFYPTEAHNGYLEIVNDLGFIGLLILLGYLIVFVRQSLALMRIDRTQGALFLCLFFQQAVNNLSESCWLAINSPYMFIVMTTATFALSRSLLDAKFKRHFSDPTNKSARTKGHPRKN